MKMRIFNHVLRTALCLTPLMGSMTPAAQAQTAAAPAPIVSPAPPPASVKPDLLDKEVVLYGFGIRPPKDYVCMQKDDGHITAFFWRGTMHQNGILPLLGLTIMHPRQDVVVRAADGHMMNPTEQAMRGVMDGVTGAFTGVKTTPLQQQRVGPLPALRIYWIGQKRVPGEPLIQMEGFAYGVQDGQNTVILMSIDCAPYGVTEFPVMDASVQTLHKVN